MAFSSKPYQSLALRVMVTRIRDTASTPLAFPVLLFSRPVPPRHPPHRALMYDLMLVSRVDRGERRASRLATE